jgi:hypothetical protein
LKKQHHYKGETIYNFEEQQYHDATRGTTILKDLQLEARMQRPKNKTKKIKKQKVTWKGSRRVLSLE